MDIQNENRGLLLPDRGGVLVAADPLRPVRVALGPDPARLDRMDVVATYQGALGVATIRRDGQWPMQRGYVLTTPTGRNIGYKKLTGALHAAILATNWTASTKSAGSA